MKLSLSSAKTLNNGTSMPLIGLGVYGIKPLESTEQVVFWAIDAGYRHIDTAKLYNNEIYVGSAVRESNIDRRDIWITTKLWPTDFRHPRQALESSLQRLGMDYVDLYLIHWPTPVEIPGFEEKLWRSMERLVDAGLCRTIGVSNYQIPRLKKILNVANISPAVNQVRCSPFTYPVALHRFCIDNDIALEAYSPLTQASRLSDKPIVDLSSRYDKSPAQILLRWALQKEIIVIPKSQNKERIYENLDLYDFAISDTDMAVLDRLSDSS